MRNRLIAGVLASLLASCAGVPPAPTAPSALPAPPPTAPAPPPTAPAPPPTAPAPPPAAALPVPPPAAPAPPRIVNVIVFPGGFNWPIWVAKEKALFARNGLEVKITPTPSSVFQLTNLIDGKFDIAMTAIDNLIAYREGQGEVPRLGPDLFAFMGCDNGFLRLVTVPEVGNYREQNRDAVVGYIRAYSDAVDWLYDPTNRDEALAIFMKNLPGASAPAALTAYGILLGSTEGFQRKAKIDMEGVKTVLALRSKYGQ